jgi:hypothetical protein
MASFSIVYFYAHAFIVLARFLSKMNEPRLYDKVHLYYKYRRGFFGLSFIYQPDNNKMSIVTPSTVDSGTLSYNDVARLAGLTDDDVSKLKFNGVEYETDLAILEVRHFRQILEGSNEIEKKATKLHTLGTFIRKDNRISMSTTMEQVYLHLQ